MGLYLSRSREEQLLVADLMGLAGTSRRVGGGFVWPSFACQGSSWVRGSELLTAISDFNAAVAVVHSAQFNT